MAPMDHSNALNDSNRQNDLAKDLSKKKRDGFGGGGFGVEGKRGNPNANSDRNSNFNPNSNNGNDGNNKSDDSGKNDGSDNDNDNDHEPLSPLLPPSTRAAKSTTVAQTTPMAVTNVPTTMVIASITPAESSSTSISGSIPTLSTTPVSIIHLRTINAATNTK